MSPHSAASSVGRPARPLRPLVGAVLAVALLELLIRSFDHYSNEFEPGYGLIFTSGSTVRHWNEHRAVSRWGAHGVRATSDRATWTPGGVLVLGDSFTEALMTEDDRVFTAVAERLLAGAGMARPVLNAGRSGASVADYVAFAPRHLSRFNPAWTVVQVSDPDFGAEAWTNARAHFERTPSSDLAVTTNVAEDEGTLRRALRATRNWFALPGFVYRRWKELAQAQAAEPPLFRAGSARRSGGDAGGLAETDYLVEKQLDALARAYAGRLTVLYLGTLEAGAPLRASDTEARVRAHCATRGIRLVSPRAAYPGLVSTGSSPFGYPDVPWNTGHLNDLGHRVVAERLAEEVKELARRGVL